jgi:hypothetical protein
MHSFERKEKYNKARDRNAAIFDFVAINNEPLYHVKLGVV